MSRARRWGFPSLLFSAGLHGALVGPGLLSGLQARAARQPELPASVATVGSSVEVEVPIETLAAPGLERAVEAEGATATESQPAIAAGSPPASRVSVKSQLRPTPISEPARPHPRAANALGAEQGETKAPETHDQQWPVHGVLGLGYAIARALPQAAPADAEWRELPVGDVGTIRIELSVDKGHHLTGARLLQGKPDEPAPPAVLEGLVERALLLLHGGQFALSASDQPGVERLAIDVTIRARASDEKGADAVVQKAFSGATPARPGRAYFRYGTGCAIEATVTVVR